MWQVVTPTGGFGGQEFVPPDERDRPVKDMVFEIYQSIKGSPIVSAVPLKRLHFHRQVALTWRSLLPIGQQ